MDMLSKIFEAAIVTLREGVEVALVIGVLLAYLRRTGRGAYTGYVLWGLGVGVLASLAIAALVHRFGLEPENPVVEGTVMFVAAGLVTSLLVWMWRTGRSVRRRLEHRLDTLVGQGDTSAPEFRAALGVFAFTFFMVLREGVETALFLTALAGTVSGSPLYNALGGGTGLLLATLFGILLGRGSLHINLRRFFNVTGIVLMILVAKLIAGGLHEFLEVGLLPASSVLLAAVDLLTDKTMSSLILILLIAMPAVCLLWDWWQRIPLAQASLPRQPNGTST
jgi:high-affinity iron transporter